jgi:hypothetical protein
MNFKSWLLEYEDKDFDFYKNMVLGKLNLNKEQGLEQNLNTWDSDQLISILRGLGEYRQLPEVTRNQVDLNPMYLDFALNLALCSSLICPKPYFYRNQNLCLHILVTRI